MPYRDFARKLGISKSSLARLEMGEESITFKRLSQVLNPLKCQPEDVFKSAAGGVVDGRAGSEAGQKMPTPSMVTQSCPPESVPIVAVYSARSQSVLAQNLPRRSRDSQVHTRTGFRLPNKLPPTPFMLLNPPIALFPDADVGFPSEDGDNDHPNAKKEPLQTVVVGNADHAIKRFQWDMQDAETQAKLRKGCQ